MSERVILNIIYCSLAKQKVLQADHESEVCSYTEQVEILKSKNNVSTSRLVRIFASHCWSDGQLRTNDNNMFLLDLTNALLAAASSFRFMD